MIRPKSVKRLKWMYTFFCVDNFSTSQVNKQIISGTRFSLDHTSMPSLHMVNELCFVSCFIFLCFVWLSTRTFGPQFSGLFNWYYDFFLANFVNLDNYTTRIELELLTKLQKTEADLRVLHGYIIIIFRTVCQGIKLDLVIWMLCYLISVVRKNHIQIMIHKSWYHLI